MSARNERRNARKIVGRNVINHPSMQRMKRNIKEAGESATEIYRLKVDGLESYLYFDVYAMNKWVRVNCSTVTTYLDWGRVDRLLMNGSIDPNRLAARTGTNEEAFQPIIVGVDAAGAGEDQILDGTHRYVAYAMRAAECGMRGQELPLPAYVLEKPQWSQFLIPKFVAKALGLDAKYDRLTEDHKSPK